MLRPVGCNNSRQAVANPKDDGECVRILVEHGADLNATNNVKETPLTRGIERQSLESVSALIAHLAKTEEGTARQPERQGPVVIVSPAQGGRLSYRLCTWQRAKTAT